MTRTKYETQSISHLPFPNSFNIYKPRCEAIGTDPLSIPYNITNESTNRKQNSCFPTRIQCAADEDSYVDDISINN